ncbi:hypothetical protein H4R34_000717 [Dimargaris verticillata]|uniref:Peptidase S1 domain-containing protein n=1 Tax=Dimargaris verticillata TaxID=2761393 RepID=A0A9W8B5Q9_9FUNG|nr:hypothetical protein H4R34_000717 [Dimargaris verticillata]
MISLASLVLCTYCILVAVIGVQAARFDRRIVGGTNAANTYSFLTLVETLYNGQASYCGGALLPTYQHVLTTAHCVQPRSVFRQGDQVVIRVGLGSNHRAQLSWYSTASVTVHPDYEAATRVNDIAVVKLPGPFTNHPTIKPISIYTSELTSYTAMLTLGWGQALRTENRSLPSASASMLAETVQEIGTVILNNRQVCSFLNANFTHSDNNFICTQFDKGRDTCYDDAGGPLFTQYHNQWVLAGVNSYSGSLTMGTPCGASSSVSYFTHAAYYLPFIATATNTSQSQFEFGNGKTNTQERPRAFKDDSWSLATTDSPLDNGVRLTLLNNALAGFNLTAQAEDLGTDASAAVTNTRDGLALAGRLLASGLFSWIGYLLLC